MPQATATECRADCTGPSAAPAPGPAALTATPMTSSTRPAPNRALSSVPVASPKLLTMSEARVAAGDLSEWAMNGELPMTRATATVSPRARPMARVKPPRMPVRAPGHHHLAQDLPPGGAEGHAPPRPAPWARRPARRGRWPPWWAGPSRTGSPRPAADPTPSFGPLNRPVHPSTEVRKGSTCSGRPGRARSAPTGRRPRWAPRPAARPRSTAAAGSGAGTRWARAMAVPRPMGTRQHQGDGGGLDGAEDEREQPVLAVGRVPDLLEDPREAERREGRLGLDDDRDHDTRPPAPTKIAATATRIAPVGTVGQCEAPAVPLPSAVPAVSTVVTMVPSAPRSVMVGARRGAHLVSRACPLGPGHRQQLVRLLFWTAGGSTT